MCISDMVILVFILVVTSISIAMTFIWKNEIDKNKKLKENKKPIIKIVLGLLLIVFLWYNYITSLVLVINGTVDKEIIGCKSVYITEVTNNTIAVGTGKYLQLYSINNLDVVESDENKLDYLKVRYKVPFIFNSLYLNFDVEEYKVYLTKDLCMKLEDKIWYNE